MANGGGGTRASDAERQKVIELLRHHTGAGRLTLDEFAERAGDVYAAVTRAELAQVVADLPEGVRPEVGPAAATADAPAFGSAFDATTAAEGRPGPARRRWFVAIMSGTDQRGRWRAPEEMTAVAFWGGVTIDLRDALIETPVVEIRAWAIMGGVDIIVPPGIPVEMHGLVVMGGSTNRVRDGEQAIPGAPLVRVRTRGLWGGVTVRNPRRKRHHHGHGGGGSIHAEVHRLVEDALDVARGAVDRALTTGSASDRIPRLPGDRRRTRSPSRSRSDRIDRGDSIDSADRGDQGVTDEAASPRDAAGPVHQAADRPVEVAGTGSHAGGDVQAGTEPWSGTDPSRDGAGAPPALANGAAGATGSPSRIPSGTLTILVSDIAGSTSMTERFGDQDWIEILQDHNAIVRRQVAQHGGTEVKAQGDGFLVVFPSARSAVLAAIAIQRAMAAYRQDHPEVPIDVRLGLHTGEVVATDDDVFGHNVVVASRIADSADPGEIVVSSLTRDLTASASDLSFDAGLDIELRGISQRWRVHRVIWK